MQRSGNALTGRRRAPLRTRPWGIQLWQLDGAAGESRANARGELAGRAMFLADLSPLPPNYPGPLIRAWAPPG